MSVTQQQIADKLKISRSLVARALRGHTAVALHTRQQVEAAARELGYNASSNHEARQLANSRYGQRLKTNTLAVVFPSMGLAPRRIPFFTPLIEGMEAEAEGLGLDVCVCLMRSGELPRLIQTRSVDGVIVLGEVSSHITAIQKIGLPVVTFENSSKTAHSIARDDRQGTYQATHHLLALGHRNIAFLGIQQEPTSALRLQGYLDAMNEAGITVHDEWIDASLTLPVSPPDSYCAGCNECAACLGWTILRDKNGGSRTHHPNFSAIVCHNDPVAMGVIAHARQDGLEVPRDLSITGFDDVSCQYHFHPEVTSIRFPRQAMGAGAVRLLHQAIEADNNTRLNHLIFPTELVVRQSTAVPAVRE